MKRNEIKKMVEQVVKVEFVAEDGTVFYSEGECAEYEESALFAVSKNLKKISNPKTSIYDLNNDGCEENELEIFDIQTPEDLENLRRYLYLKLSKNGASETTIKSLFEGDGSRKDFIFDGVTYGHEVMVFWSYDGDWAWTYNDGSLNGYFEWLRGQYDKIVTPKAKKQEN